MWALAKHALGRKHHHQWPVDEYGGGGANQSRNRERLVGDAYAHPRGYHGGFLLGPRSQNQGFSYPRMHMLRRPNFNTYAGGFRRPHYSPFDSGYRYRSSPYRNPYMGFGYRPRSNYGRSPWNSRPRYPTYYARHGYPPSSYRREAFSPPWNDGISDDEEDDFSDYEDTYHRPYGRQRTYATDYDDEDDDFWGEDEYDSDDDEMGYHQPLGHTSQRYGSRYGSDW